MRLGRKHVHLFGRWSEKIPGVYAEYDTQERVCEVCGYIEARRLR